MANTFEPSGMFGESAASASTQPKWWWRLERSSGDEVRPEAFPRQDFPSQGDAESWVGEVWRDLLDEGVDAVRLFEGDREVYGPMSLHEA